MRDSGAAGGLAVGVGMGLVLCLPLLLVPGSAGLPLIMTVRMGSGVPDVGRRGVEAQLAGTGDEAGYVFVGGVGLFVGTQRRQ